MSVEVRAQNTISMTSVKAIKDATDQSAQLLAEMEEYAEDAGTTLTGIYQVAKDAETSANNAQASANNAQASAETALTNLSQVQSVLDVVNWVALHGEYEKTTDVAINPNKTYYTVTATAVATPTDDDIGTYYELVSGEYVKTTDTTVVTGKTYYYVVGTPVTDPDVSDIGTYYELFINEAMTNYIMSHLALTNDGLYVMADNSEWKVLVASDGVYILDPSNKPINQMKNSGDIVGYIDEMHLALTSNGMSVTDPFGVDVFKVSTSGNSETRYVNTEVAGTTTVYKDDELTYTISPMTDTGFVNYIFSVIVRKGNQQSGVTYTVTSFPYSGNLPSNTGTISVTNNNDGTLTLTLNASTGFTLLQIGAQMAYIGDCGTLSLGFNNTVTGDYSIALGTGNRAVGKNCIVAGVGNSSNNFNNAFVIGKYNIYRGGAFEIGNGTNDANRSNAFTVDWSGNVVASGDITDGYGNTLSNVSVNSTDVPTADTIAEFDSTAHMNSTDMTSQEVSDFVDGLDASGGNLTVVVQKVSATVNRAVGSNVSVTAPDVAGKSFICWVMVATNGWVGSVYPSTPMSQTSVMWVSANASSAGTGTIDCYAMYQ